MGLGESDGFKVFADRIQTPGDGCIIFQGMQDHTAESIKSLEGFKRAWVEEAQTISDKSLKLLTPSVRSVAGSDRQPEIWFTMNRGSRKDPIAQTYLKREESELNKCGSYENNLMIALQIN